MYAPPQTCIAERTLPAPLLKASIPSLKRTNMQFIRSLSVGLQLTSRFYREELLAIVKDTGALLILFLALIIYPLIYGLAYKKEVLQEVPVALVDLDGTATSRQVARMVDATEELHLSRQAPSLKEAEGLFYAGEVNAVLVLPEAFEEDIMAGKHTQVGIYSDAAYFLLYKQSMMGALQAVGTFSGGVEVRRLLASGLPMEQALRQRDPVALRTTLLFNPSGGYNSFVVPGLLLVIIQQTLLIGIGLLGGTDRERGRFRFAVPGALHKGGIVPVVLGKAGAYLSLYLLNLVITQVWVYHWFSLPDKTSWLPALALMLPFLLAVIFLGMALSTFFARREHSILFVVFLSPLVLFLTGLSWPASAIPSWLQTLAHVFPSTTMVPAWLRVRTMGAGMEHIGPALGFLLVQALLYFLLTLLAYYRVARRQTKQP